MNGFTPDIIKDLSATGVLLLLMLMIIKLGYDFVKSKLHDSKEAKIKHVYAETLERARAKNEEIFKEQLQATKAMLVNTIETSMQPLMKEKDCHKIAESFVKSIMPLLESNHVKEILREVINEQNTRAVLVGIVQQELAKVLREMEITDDKIDTIINKIDQNSIVILNMEHDISKFPLPQLRNLE